MSTYYVTCHTPDNFDLDRRLQGLGGHRNGQGWWYSIDVIVQLIERENQTFFTDPPSGTGRLVVVRETATGKKYLKTLADGVYENNLLSLKHCP